MSRYIPATPATPSHTLSTSPIPPSTAHSLLTAYLTSCTSSQPWSHSHDAGTTASLKKIELSLRGIHGPDVNSHFIDSSSTQEEIEDDLVSKVDTDEGGEIERRRVFDTIEDLDRVEDERIEEEEGLKELQSVKVVEEGEEMEVEEEKVDKEERKRLKKLRHKEEKRRKEAERVAERE